MKDEVKETEVIEEVQEEVLENTATIMVGEKEYNLEKHGMEQAQQVSSILNWLGKYGSSIATKVMDDDGNVTLGEGGIFQLLGVVGEVATPDALVELFVVVTGCSKKEAKEHFNISTLIDGIEVLLGQEEYVKVVNRFFSIS